MKKKYAGDDSENEFSVDEPEELQGSDDDWTPGCGEVCLKLYLLILLIYGTARDNAYVAFLWVTYCSGYCRPLHVDMRERSAMSDS